MTSKARGWVILAAGLVASLARPDVLRACYCVESPPPCQAIGQSELIFVGTVLEVPVEKPSKLGRMRVDRVYKGKLPAEVDLDDDGMCDGPDLKVGRQYLMYTHRFPSGVIPALGCT